MKPMACCTCLQEIKATLPADPTLKIQIVRFLVETNHAPEVLDAYKGDLLKFYSFILRLFLKRFEEETMRLQMNRVVFFKE